MYKIYDHVVYGHMEPPVPCSIIYTSENLNEIKTYINNLDTKKNTYFVFSDNEFLYQVG